MIVVRKHKGEDRLDITLHEVVSDVDCLMDEDAARLEKDGVERDLQELLADRRSAAATASGSCGASGRPTSARWT